MAIDSRIQTTVTAGRSGKKAPYDFDQGPVMIILLSCLAVAMCFTTLGMGFVNIATGMNAKKAALALAKAKPLPPAPKEEAKPDSGKSDQAIEMEIRKLQEQGASVEKEREALTSKLESAHRNLDVERESAVNTRQRIDELRTQTTRIAASLGDLRTKLADNSAEARRQLQLRAQLEQQKSEASRQIAETERRIQELRKAIEEKKSTFDATAAFAPGTPTSFVECSREGVSIIGRAERFSMQELGRNPGGFLKVLGKRQVQFLIRPDGFSAFNAARDAAEKNGVAIGYEPVDANWRLK